MALLLSSAVGGHGLRAVYQPIVDLARGVAVGAQGYHLGRPAEPWAPVTEAASQVLLRRRARPAGDTLRRLVDHPPVVHDASAATDAFTDPAVDLVVLCDEHDRPLAAFDDRTAPVPIVAAGLRINVDTPISDAALRTITRTDWAQPLLCTDNAGRHVGVVRIPRLLHALAVDPSTPDTARTATV